MIDEAYTVKGKMDQAERHHGQAMRAQALATATALLSSSGGTGMDILREVIDQPNTSGTRKLELLTNHLLTFIETGKFL